MDQGALANANGVQTGVNTFGLVVNPAIFQVAGVPLPDDDTWTWADYERIAADISAIVRSSSGAMSSS